MNKRNILIGMVTTALLFSGCGANQSEIPTETGKNIAITSSVDTSSNVNTEVTDYETVGEIIEFDGQNVHIITGDIVEIFTISADLENFYLGQTVYVTKETETDYSLMPYEQKDFTIRHTNMGHMIERKSGQVISIKDGKAELDTEEGIITVSISEDMYLEENVNYEFDIIVFENKDYFLENAYNTDWYLTLVIDSLTRNQNGELEIFGIENETGRYIVDTYQAVKNFNLSDLMVGQTINVYTNAIEESDPAQVPAIRIDLVDASGESTLAHEVIGEIVEIKGNEVHILSGDMVEIFYVNEDKLKDFFLGETVKLYDDQGDLRIQSYLVEDFSIRHNGMGALITETLGKVTKIRESAEGALLTLEIDGESKDYNFYGDNIPKLEATYEFELVSYSPEEVTIFTYYDPESVIKMTIKGMTRADNGELILETEDLDGGLYNIGTSTPLKNFNLSELKAGDMIHVYANAVMESWPMQVDTNKILRVTER